MTDQSDSSLLSNGHLTLRALETSDIDRILEWENDTRAWTTTSTAAPYSRRIIEEYVMTYDTDIFASRQLRLMIDEGATTVGTIDLYEFDPISRRAGLGIVIDTQFRGRGLGAEAIGILVRYCSYRLGLHQIWAIVSENNPASRQMLETAGFKISGRMKSWIRVGSGYEDAYFFQLIIP